MRSVLCSQPAWPHPPLKRFLISTHYPSREARMRRVSVFLLFLLPLTMSCATYYTTRTRGPQTVLTFDRTLLEALDEVLAKCHDPLSINPSQPLALSGDCVPADLSTDAKALWVPLAAEKPLDLSGIFSAALAQKLHAEYATDKIDHCLINF